MGITPLDLRQQRFRTRFRGFDRVEVGTYLAEAAEGREAALREIENLRRDVPQMEADLAEHREREADLRTTLMTAQRFADDLRQNAQQEAATIVRGAQGRADLLLQHAQARLDDFEREISEAKLRVQDVERSIETSISALQHALEFIRAQNRPEREERLRLHRPRNADSEAGPRETSSSSPQDRQSQT